jgi:hypothetical protein
MVSPHRRWPCVGVDVRDVPHDDSKTIIKTRLGPDQRLEHDNSDE